MSSFVVALTAPRNQEDDLVSALYECGSMGVEIQNFESETVSLQAFFPDTSPEFSSRVVQRLSVLIPREIWNSHTLVRVPEQDWLKRWRDSLKPFSVGETFLVVPTSFTGEAPDPGKRVVLRIDPGMAFGTGTHESTQLCLEIMEHLDLNQRAVLDVGTGTGILSIAAVRLGAKKVFACDSDDTAVPVAISNLQINGVAGEVDLWSGSVDAVRTESVELCMGNLMKSVFEQLWPDLQRIIVPGGRLICSGILEDQSVMFQEELKEARFQVEEMKRANEWVGFLARKELQYG